MKVAALTWEFPPVITGGLGMACYGIVKALLKYQTHVDLIMPTKQPAFFALKNPEDADTLPVTFIQTTEHKAQHLLLSKSDLQKLIGNPISAYYTIDKSSSISHSLEELKKLDPNPFEKLFNILSDKYHLFRKVRHYTESAVQIAASSDFDIIHAHDWLTYPAGMILKKITGKPLVAHVHATEFDRAGGPGDGRIHNIEYMGMKYADSVITVSDYTANIVAHKYNISRDKITVIHNAYSIAPVDNNRRIFKEPVVLFMGRITLQKGPDYFLEVARKVLQREKKVRFLMAGSGDMEKHILHKAASLGLGTRLLFAGFLERHEVQKALSATDIFILPSVSEPFGIAPLEAMSHGAIAIISKNAGVAEVIENAYKIDFWDTDKMANTIVELIRDPKKVKEVAEKSKQEVQKLQWENTVQKLTDLFCQLKQTQICST
ncbi:glycosyltransferase [Planctomycetota bacterium]